MKFIRLATIAALSTTLFAGEITAFADERRQVNTNGNIQFTPSTDEPQIVVPPENEPDVEINPEVPGTTGPLSIVKAATMNFGSQVISNQDQTYNMIAERQQKTGTTGDENKVPYVSFAQVSDTRGSNAGWDLKVSLSDFQAENTQNAILRGAEVTLKDPQIQYTGNNQELAPAAHANNLKLIPNNTSVSVMTAEQGKGAGVSSVVWGNQADLDAQVTAEGDNIVTNDAIQLSVPGASAKDATTYTSTLKWELMATPSSDAGI
ncbi:MULTISPECIES: WxL domain-containing protein [unclassified Enterococcus]|uniref:WxL domain-containing protein n=1 Tax=unclassified Enterococcus TaxID=2608891 RepID=UPI0019040764|nr:MULTISPECIES: WxL domain-containing protein [unclassified Enterococcus]MBK0039234.1 WxL domain-containing protein [Enterococcus sp. S52]MBK0071882.1 WxL domain-containing protein [Enterococcus sp. S53]MBK0142474.1 WxL domain-containing protein [Enterococcus sp. S76]MBK0146169.1 WxL domain-containing protein [Enterococcus sp. S77]